jgi:Na+/H+-dicarboxylate symporter
VLAAIGSLVIRFRRSRGDERQQLKWFAYAGALQPLILLADFLPAGLSNLYRLYEIDRLINRTLVYGLVTALLAGVYIGLVFLLGNLLNPADGSSELAVAASTLAVVDQTVQPTAASLWLRPTPRGPARRAP